MMDPIRRLLPRPRRASPESGAFELSDRPLLAAADGVPGEAARRLSKALAEVDVRPRMVSEGPDSGRPAPDLRLEIGEEIGGAEAYRLTIDRSGVAVRGGGPAGVHYGVATLAQWLRIHSRPDGSGRRMVPALSVADEPDFPHRGVMLDVSRDKVPTLDTLERLIDLLAGWKINQLQLYMEHTFAYRGHEAVWRDASPLTAADVRALDAYCRERQIDLVPNQNSFGHMHRWLVHEPYRGLAECPEGVEHPFSFEREPYGLCPTDPRSLEFLAGLYDELLPCFGGGLFNVGLDETFDLGRGRSAGACAERGKGRVYLDFLTRVHRLVAERGRRMQFWGDVILDYPELLAELPRDAVALEWGYEADHPFAEDARRFAESGLEFYVCPGTSSWNSFAGRTRNAVDNLASAAIHGQAHGASGYLITDWGDNGHLQPLPVSYPGLAAGAAFGWNVEDARAPDELPLEELLDLHVFGDRARVAGGVVTGLGDAYLETGAEAAKNGSTLFFALVFAPKSRAERRGEGMTAASLERTLAHVEGTIASLPAARIERDGARVTDELTWTADVLRLACRLSLTRIAAGEDTPLDALPAGERRTLSRNLDELVERHREIWLRRNRRGGLEDSAANLTRVGKLLVG